MNTKQKIRLNMYLAVRYFVNLNEQAVKNIPKFAASFTKLQNTVEEIQQIAEMQGINKTGLALDKKKLKKQLIEMSVKFSNKIAILAKASSNETLLKEVRLKESDLIVLAAVTLRDRAQLIYDRAQANLGMLEEQGITQDTQKQFLETINAFNNSIAAPRAGITERRQATQKIPVLFDLADAEIDTMDLAAGSAKYEYPDFYNGYKNSRKLVDTSSGSLALKAAARDITNGEPVSGALFTFKQEASGTQGGNGNGEIIKKTSRKGNFHLKSMQPGTYKVVVSKDGYRGKEASVKVNEGERSELVVELEKM
jgi:hypothetical protein